MPVYVVRGPDGRTYDVPAPEGTPDANLIAQAQRMSLTSDGAKAPAPTAPSATQDVTASTPPFSGLAPLADTLGLGRSEARTIWKPETVGEYIGQAATIPAMLATGGGFAGAGALATRVGLRAIAGRLGFGAALGGVKGAIDPNDTAMAGAAKGLGAAIVPEAAASVGGTLMRSGSGALNVASAVARKIAESKSGAAILKAVESLDDRFKGLLVRLPSLNLTPNLTPAPPAMTVAEAAKKIAYLKGPQLDQASNELAYAVDMMGRGRQVGAAGDAIRDAVAPSRFAAIADMLAKVPDVAARLVTSTPVRVAADTLGAQNPRDTIATGIQTALETPGALKGLATSMMPVADVAARVAP